MMKSPDFQENFGIEPWNFPVDGKALYEELKQWLSGFVRMPNCGCLRIRPMDDTHLHYS